MSMQLQQVAALTRRILIIDDEAHIVEVVQACLETLGDWSVITATSSREGLLKVQLEQPDVIILDVMMPEMNGFAFLQTLRVDQQTQSIPVILLTAQANALNLKQLSALGVVAAIAKPFNPIILSTQILTALSWS